MWVLQALINYSDLPKSDPFNNNSALNDVSATKLEATLKQESYCRREKRKLTNLTLARAC